MGEPALLRLDRERIRCERCGEEQDALLAAASGRCPECGHAIATPAGGESALKELLAEPEPRPRIHSPRTEQALAEVLAKGPQDETPRMVQEVIAVEKRGGSLLAFVPFVGAWLIQRSEQHTPQEKRRLSLLSLTLTLAIVVVVWSMLPTDADRLAGLRERVASEMNVLGGVADAYRADHGSYPDEATWKRFAERADGRFFDPWARPYLYSPHEDGITLETLGRGGREGGSGEDADITVEHEAPATAPQP